MKQKNDNRVAAVLTAVSMAVMGLIAVAALSSCGSQKVVERELRTDTLRVMVHDTLRQVVTERDSVYLRDSVYMQGDMLVKERVYYRDRWRIDTLWRVREASERASIVHQSEKRVEPKKSRWERFREGIQVIAGLGVAFGLGYWFGRWRR